VAIEARRERVGQQVSSDSSHFLMHLIIVHIYRSQLFKICLCCCDA
jgi:hypothetical protein